MRILKLALIALLPLTVELQAQNGSFTTFGNGCGGLSGSLLSAAAPPRIGKSFTVTVGIPLQPCCLPLLRWSSTVAIGVSNTNWRGIRLPYPLAGCSLLVGPDVLVSKLLNGSCCPPRDQLTAKIPSSAALVGVSFYVQWVQSTQSRGAWFSHGGRGTIGR